MKEIELTQGKVAMVDDEDYERLSWHRWYALLIDGTWYALTNRGGKKILMHRVVSDAPEGVGVDHADHNGLNNQRSNLRHATVAQNCQNRKKRSDNTSGYKGVSPQGKKWKASIKTKNKQTYLGTFSDPVDAAKAYDAKAIELFGEFAALNFPEG